LVEHEHTYSIINYPSHSLLASNAHVPLLLQQCSVPSCPPLILTNVHALGLKIFPGLNDLSLQLFVRIRDVVEREDSPTELEEEVCAKGNEGPEGKLL
jgi:hypothetical protein